MPRRDAAAMQPGDGLAPAVELAVIPLLMALIGLAADHRLGSGPLFTIVLLMAGVAGGFARAYYAYQHQCSLEEERRPWLRPGR